MGIKKRKLIIQITTNFNLKGAKEKRIFKILVTIIKLIKISGKFFTSSRKINIFKIKLIKNICILL